MMKITCDEMGRLVEKVMKPDNSFDLRDVERELVAETGMSAKDAKRVVRAWDRQMQVRPGDLAKLWAYAAKVENENGSKPPNFV